MDTKIYATPVYQEVVRRVAVKEAELLYLLQAKSEKLCNDFLAKNQHTQLSYLTREEQIGAVALPKDILLDKLLHYLRSV